MPFQGSTSARINRIIHAFAYLRFEFKSSKIVEFEWPRHRRGFFPVNLLFAHISDTNTSDKLVVIRLVVFSTHRQNVQRAHRRNVEYLIEAVVGSDSVLMQNKHFHTVENFLEYLNSSILPRSPFFNTSSRLLFTLGFFLSLSTTAQLPVKSFLFVFVSRRVLYALILLTLFTKFVTVIYFAPTPLELLVLIWLLVKLKKKPQAYYIRPELVLHIFFYSQRNEKPCIFCVLS